MERSCYRNSPTAELNECIKTNCQNGVPRFISGLPGVFNGTLEPFYWPKFAHFFNRGLIQGGLIVRDITILGVPAVKFLAIRANAKDPQKLHVDMDWRIPKLDISGQFKGNGKMGPVTFDSAGPFVLNLTGLVGTWKMTGSRQKGQPFMEITSFRGVPKIKTLKLWAKGAVLGNDELNDLVLATINRAWKLFYEIASPTVDKEWGTFVKEKLNRIFLNVPYDELLPLRKP